MVFNISNCWSRLSDQMGHILLPKETEKLKSLLLGPTCYFQNLPSVHSCPLGERTVLNDHALPESE